MKDNCVNLILNIVFVLHQGVVADWKNWFTVAMNEYFDGRWKAEINPQSMFTFKYE